MDELDFKSSGRQNFTVHFRFTVALKVISKQNTCFFSDASAYLQPIY